MEENNKTQPGYSYVIRQTSVLLIMRILLTEFSIMTLHYFIRIIIYGIYSYIQSSPSVLILTIEVILIQLLNIFLLLSAIMSWLSEHYVLNPKEVIVKKGFVNTKSTTYEFANLQSMTVTQNLFEKIFNYGTIKLFNPVLKEEVYITNIGDPIRYANIIQQHQPEITPLIKKQKN